MKFNQYIHILLVAGSALTALITLIASDSRGFLFLLLNLLRYPWHFRTTSAVVTFFLHVNVSASGYKVCSERGAEVRFQGNLIHMPECL